MSTAPDPVAKPYFPRKLTALDEPDMGDIQDADLLSIMRPIVILGEPGMGKSEMIRHLSQRAGVASVSASRFMSSRDPRAFADRGEPLLIDALDEAIARSDGDAVDRILASLEDAGSPRFILSCRAREWQSRTERDLKEIYGAGPLVVSINEFTRDESRAFWTTRGFRSDADRALERMDEQNLSNLYKNPLTLTLLGDVADSGRALPATRAELFERVCELSWPESDKLRQDSPLAKLTQEQALSAAGAMMASAILAGAEAISLMGVGAAADGDLPIAELEALPGAQGARAVISSKLFKSVGQGRAAPIHRVIAEFLGARWLGRQVTTSRARRRLLAQFQGSGAVPSSLRGLHAWLSFHSPQLAHGVISADPFGLLRYGESSMLDATQAATLLDSLERLSRNDPYFRAQDWDARTALGLAQPALASRIEVAIGDLKRNFHLRLLLLESIKGSPIAEQLSGLLEHIVLAADRYYAERNAAVEALLQLRDRSYWRMIVEKLLGESSEDSARLCGRLIKDIEYDLPDDVLVKGLLKEMDLLDPPTSKIRGRRFIRIHRFDQLAATLSPPRAKAVLRLLVMAVVHTSGHNIDECGDLSRLACLLLLRALRGGQISLKDVPSLWNWLEVASLQGVDEKGHSKDLISELRTRDELRRATQRYGIWKEKRRKPLWHTEHHLRKRSISLTMNPQDAAFFLNEISGRTGMSQRQRSDWQALVDIGIRVGADNSLVVNAALALSNLSIKQMAHLRSIQRPRKYRWQIENELQTLKRDSERALQRDRINRDYEGAVVQVRLGDLSETVQPAKVYLGLEMWDASDIEKPAESRLSAFFNELLAKEFMVGFEAALHRSDLPTIAEIATSYPRGTIFNFSYPIISGLLSRVRAGSGFDSVPHRTLNAGLLLCMQRRHGFGIDEDIEVLRRLLEREVALSVQDKVQLARTWIEPLLAESYSAEHDIGFMANLPDWAQAGCSLASEWLLSFPDAPLASQLEIVAMLVSAGETSQILDIARKRDRETHHSDEQALAWLAIDVVYRFDEVRGHLAGIGQANPEFIWALRDRLQLRRRGPFHDISVATSKWIVSEFRRPFPYATLEGVGSGSTNGYDATDFLRSLVARLADDTGDQAISMMRELSNEPADHYTDMILHMAAEQWQKQAEEKFEAINPRALAAVLEVGPPANIDDLKSLIVEELNEVQRRLLGDELDQVRDFWGHNEIPYGENRCRDRLVAMVDTRLADMYSVKRMTEADMPKDKRADIAFASGPVMQLPVEVKGQWHVDVWDAASDQLEAKYLIDWRSEGRGIYCVFWFGTLSAATGRRLKAHPDGLPAPASAAEMRSMINDRIPSSRRPFIDVVVIDLDTGRRKNAQV